jgi:polar amino acid transport system substrate-binding protein
VRTGKADITAGNVYINDERAELYEISEPVYSDKMALLTSDGASTIDALKGLQVGTPQGYLWVEDLQNALGTDNVKLYATEDAVYQDVRAGRIAAGVMTFGGAAQSLKANNDEKLKVAELESDERVAASVGAARTAALITKGNTKLQEATNTIIEQMREDGSLKKALEDNGLPGSAAEVE